VGTTADGVEVGIGVDKGGLVGGTGVSVGMGAGVDVGGGAVVGVGLTQLPQSWEQVLQSSIALLHIPFPQWAEAATTFLTEKLFFIIITKINIQQP